MAVVPYHTRALFEGQHIEVDIPELSVPKCGACGELVFNYVADEQIVKAVEAQAKRSIPTLAPQEYEQNPTAGGTS